MTNLADTMKIALIAISLTLIGLVMLQVKGGGLGDMFGGSDLYRTRRGVEKTIFQMTVVFSTLFLVVALLSVMYS